MRRGCVCAKALTRYRKILLTCQPVTLDTVHARKEGALMQIFYQDTIGDEHFRVLAEYDAPMGEARIVRVWPLTRAMWRFVPAIPWTSPTTLALLRGSCLRKCIQARQELQDSIVNTSVDAMKERA